MPSFRPDRFRAAEQRPTPNRSTWRAVRCPPLSIGLPLHLLFGRPPIRPSTDPILLPFARDAISPGDLGAADRIWHPPRHAGRGSRPLLVCAGYYSCTELGFCEIVRARQHVWAPTRYVYAAGTKSDRRAMAWEPFIIDHVECTAEGLGILVYPKALLNYPRLSKYPGAHLLPKCMKSDPNLFMYSNYEVEPFGADAQDPVEIPPPLPSGGPHIVEASAIRSM